MTVTYIDDARGPGRRPPYDLRAEESLLGAMLLSQDSIAAGAERLHSGDFYGSTNGHIFDAITTLASAGEPVDPVTTASELERAGLLADVGGPAVLVNLQMGTPSTSNAARYAADIEACALLRRLIETGSELVELGYNGRGDHHAALDQAEASVFALTQRRITDSTRQIGDLIAPGIDRLEQLYEQGDSITGLPTGFTDLDDITSGLQPGGLHVLGARPSAGKTSLALNVAAHVGLEQKTPTYIFSLEMSGDELFQRLFCAESRVDSKRLRNGQLVEKDWERIAQTTSRFADAPIWIDDNPNLTITELRAKARRLQSKVGNLGLIVVDYIQLMTGRSSAENRQVQISEISRGLKILARELQCPVIALSQLSRQLESRDDKRPRLSDLRESGSIEQDADVVMFIYRDEIYNTASDDRGTAEIIVAKQRNGPTGVVRLAFLAQYTKFANLSRGGR